MSTEEFGESEFRIAVWFGRELHIACRSKGSNAFNRPDAANGNLARWSDINPIGDAVECRGMGEELAWFCFVAKAGGEVHWPTDVIVAIEQQRSATRNACAQINREGFEAAGHFSNGRNDWSWLHSNKKDAVTQPLGHAHATATSDFFYQGSEDLKRTDGAARTMSFSECGESTDVDKGKGAFEGNRATGGRNFLGTFGAHAGCRRGRHWSSGVGVELLGAGGIIRHDPMTMTQIEPASQSSFGNIR
jgi:hypothetical protein